MSGIDFLKPLLGDDLFAQVSTALEGKDDVKIANLASGNYIKKENHEAKLREVETVSDGYKSQVDALTTDMEALKNASGDIEAMKTTIVEMQTTHKDKVLELETGAATAKKQHAIDLAVLASGGLDTRAVGALLNAEAVTLDGDNLIGLNDQLKTLKESKGFLFGDVKPEDTPPGNPPGDDTPPADELEALSDDEFYKKRMAERQPK